MFTLPSMESIEDVQKRMKSNPDFTEQPVVPIYVPEEDGTMELYEQIPLPGVLGYPMRWSLDPSNSMENIQGGSQQIEGALSDGTIERFDPTIYLDGKSMYITTPETDPELIERIDTDKVLGIYIDGDIADYPQASIEALASIGFERVCLSLESLSDKITLL